MNQENIQGLVWRRRIKQRVGTVAGDIAVGVVMVAAAILLIVVSLV